MFTYLGVRYTEPFQVHLISASKFVLVDLFWKQGPHYEAQLLNL